jgi:hypothetical protein
VSSLPAVALGLGIKGHDPAGLILKKYFFISDFSFFINSFVLANLP